MLRSFPFFLLLALLTSACGASMTELAAQGRYSDACDTFGPDDEQADAKNAFLMGEVAQRTEATVTTHVFTLAELEEALPHVPARMASGEVVMVSTDVVYTGGEAWELTLRTHPLAGDVFGRRIPCCGMGEWMKLDGRADEWEEMREEYTRAQREARARARERRERYSGPLGAMRAVGEMLAGVASDLTFIGTVGLIDVDVTDLPFAQLSGLQGMRAIGRRVHESITRDHPPTPADEETELAARRAESFAILRHLLTRDGSCVGAGSDGTCRAVALYALPRGSEVTAVRTFGEVLLMSDDSMICDISTTADAPLSATTAPRPLGAVFPPAPAPVD